MIDFHCHLDLYPDVRRVVDECVERGLYVLAVTTTPSAWNGTRSLVAGCDRIRVALGFHPQLASERKGELQLFDVLLSEARYVGEVGLDGGQEYAGSWSDQVLLFDYILSRCESVGGRVMTIHSRRAVSEVLDRIERHPGAGLPILHWYSGGKKELARAIDLGCWFSVGPGMLSGEKGREIAARLPRDRVLTETDGPFASVNGKSALPWDVEQATKVLCELWGCDEEYVSNQLGKNLRRIGQIANGSVAP